jgi:3D (Asp-Asp-Asp) domain-containing protein
MRIFRYSLALVAVALFGGLHYGLVVPNPLLWNAVPVTVTAYNSTPRQTLGDPFEAAWGDRLEPGMKSVAVSRDLLDMGLDHGTEVHIEGMDGPYLVLDKMNSRFERRVDVYMGLDVEAAREFGKQEAVIYWR